MVRSHPLGRLPKDACRSFRAPARAAEHFTAAGWSSGASGILGSMTSASGGLTRPRTRAPVRRPGGGEKVRRRSGSEASRKATRASSAGAASLGRVGGETVGPLRHRRSQTQAGREKLGAHFSLDGRVPARLSRARAKRSLTASVASSALRLADTVATSRLAAGVLSIACAAVPRPIPRRVLASAPVMTRAQQRPPRGGNSRTSAPREPLGRRLQRGAGWPDDGGMSVSCPQWPRSPQAPQSRPPVDLRGARPWTDVRRG